MNFFNKEFPIIGTSIIRINLFVPLAFKF